MPDPRDPFAEARKSSGVQVTDFNGEEIPFVLGLKELRKTVKDWETFSSDHPFKVVPHTEEKMRSMRQIPIELDPPDHTCLLYTSPSPRDRQKSRMPSSA